MSDGAAAAVVMSGRTRAGSGHQAAGAIRRLCVRRLPARRDGHRAGVRHPEGAQAGGPDLDEIDVIELNEAFAAQSLAVIKALGLDPARSTSTAAPSRSAIRWAAPEPS